MPPTSDAPSSRCGELAAIRERAEKATPGDEWQYERWTFADGGPVSIHKNCLRVGQWWNDGIPRADADFIAHAPSDIRLLLDVVRELTEGLRETVAVVGEIGEFAKAAVKYETTEGAAEWADRCTEFANRRKAAVAAARALLLSLGENEKGRES